MPITRGETARKFEIEPGVTVIVLTGAETGAASLNAGLATFEPGATLACHTHDCEESITILVGEAALDLEGRRETLSPFDTSMVPAGVPHRFANPSDSQPMTMFWVYASPAAGRTIVEEARCSTAARDI